MMIGRSLRFVSALLLAGFITSPATAQDYPTRPVRIVTDSAPGSAIDVILRVVADRLTQIWGQQVVAANHPGAGGSIAARVASQAAPDGYTLFIPALSTFVAPPGAAANLPLHGAARFCADRLFRRLADVHHGGVLARSKTLPELIALAKQKPGELTYGTNGPGRLTHLTGELLASRAGIKLLMIPYSGGTAHVLNDVMGKRVPLVIEAYSGLAGAIQAKTVVPLAVAAPKRLPEFPDVPAAAETLPGFEAGGWQVLVAPPGRPKRSCRRSMPT